MGARVHRSRSDSTVPGVQLRRSVAEHAHLRHGRARGASPRPTNRLHAAAKRERKSRNRSAAADERLQNGTTLVQPQSSSGPCIVGA